jgi:hypothetical protein
MLPPGSKTKLQICYDLGVIIATRESWKNDPMSETRSRIPYDRTFTKSEFERITRGIVPEEMEDKWFVFYEAPWLWLHRSWSGLAAFGIKMRDVDPETVTTK